MTHRFLVLAVLLLMSMALSAGCSTQPRLESVDPEADEILMAMGATLGSAKQFSFQAQATMDELLEDGPMVEFVANHAISVSRPNKVFVTAQGDMINRSVWFNDGKLAAVDNGENVYGMIDVPNKIDDMLDFMMDEYELTVPIADLLFADPYSILIENVDSGGYLGLHKIDGHPCHHLAFRQESIDWQIWVDAGPMALPRKLVITYHRSPGQPQYRATFSGWSLSPELPDVMFEFQPPDGAKCVDMDVVLGRDGGE